MNKYGLSFHHLGLATSKVIKAKFFLQGLGYFLHDEIFDPLQNVNLIMCTSSTMPDIELIYPSSSLDDGPLKTILSSNDELLYHICYTSMDLNTTIELIKKDKNRIFTISPPKEAALFSRNKVSFYKIVGFGLIEILEQKGT